MAAHDDDAASQRLMRPLKRSFAIRGHRTSISMEAPFWEALQQAAALEKSTLAALVASIARRRRPIQRRARVDSRLFPQAGAAGGELIKPAPISWRG